MKLKKSLKGIRDVRGLPRIKPNPNGEKLVEAAIIRACDTYAGWKSHSEIRRSLGDTDPYSHQTGDLEGFLTSTGRFVTRQQAVDIAIAAGQVNDSWKTARRELLSSDISW